MTIATRMMSDILIAVNEQRKKTEPEQTWQISQIRKANDQMAQIPLRFKTAWKWDIKYNTFPRVCEWVIAAEWSALAKQAMQSKRVSKASERVSGWCEPKSKQTSKWHSRTAYVLASSDHREAWDGNSKRRTQKKGLVLFQAKKGEEGIGGKEGSCVGDSTTFCA